MRPRLARDAGGVSSVLGAILMFGLLVLTLLTVQVKFVPVWDRQRETDLMQQAQGQLAQLVGDADRQADNRTTVPITDPLALSSPSGFHFFTQAKLPGSLTFLPAAAGQGFSLTTAPQGAHIQQSGGQQSFAGSESWTQYTSSTVLNVSAVQHLRLRISQTSLNLCIGGGGSGVVGTLTLGIKDANGAYAGQFVLQMIRTSPSNICSFEYDTYAATSQSSPVSVSTQAFNWQQNQIQPPPYEYVDLLQPSLQFGDVLHQAATPFTLTLTLNNMQADYTITYAQAVPGGGTVIIGGGGVLVPNFSESLLSGSLSLAANNQQFVAQTYVVEHGAVILHQADGNVMVVPPEFTASLAGGQVNLAWVVPAFTGTAGAITGPPSASVVLTPGSSRFDVGGSAPRLTFTLTSQYPAVWTNFWTTTLQSAGLTSTGGTPQFTTTTSATTASLTVFGVDSNPNSSTDDVNFALKGAAIGLQAVAAGS